MSSKISPSGFFAGRAARKTANLPRPQLAAHGRGRSSAGRFARVSKSDCPRNCPGGCVAVWDLRERWRPSPRSFSTTSRHRGLDPVTAAAIDQLIKKTRDDRHVTSVVVSHDMGSIFRIADKVLMIYEGRAQIYGTPQEILDSKDPVVRQFILGEVTGPIGNARRRGSGASARTRIPPDSESGASGTGRDGVIRMT